MCKAQSSLTSECVTPKRSKTVRKPVFQRMLRNQYLKKVEDTVLWTDIHLPNVSRNGTGQGRTGKGRNVHK